MAHNDRDAFPASMSTCLHLPADDSASVEDLGFGVLKLGDRSAEVEVFCETGAGARRVAEAATTWAELAEARERGEDVALWGSWVVPADKFGDRR
jgi:hypothetical protein